MAQNDKPSPHSVVVVSDSQISCEAGGDACVLHLEEGVYYSMSEVGARVWELIQEPKILHEVQAQLMEEYEVEAEQCERELLTLIGELAAKKLVEIRNGPTR